MKNQQIDFSTNILQALLWRFNKAARLQSLLTAKQAWYDTNQTAFWSSWLTNIFDIRTANNFGCTVWAILLGVPITIIQTPDYLTKPVWGFGTYHRNFNRGNFAIQKTSAIPLTLEQKRLILQLRYAQLISRGTVTQTNALLKYIFNANGFPFAPYVLDGLDMTMKVVFPFAIPAALLLVLNNYDILPRPDGVKLDYVQLARPTFGFGSFHRNFNRGTFAS